MQSPESPEVPLATRRRTRRRLGGGRPPREAPDSGISSRLPGAAFPLRKKKILGPELPGRSSPCAAAAEQGGPPRVG